MPQHYIHKFLISLFFQKETLKEILENLETSNQNKEPTKHIGEYSVLELLGTGAFGSVYKVKKQTAGQSYLAMKEVSSEVMFPFPTFQSCINIISYCETDQHYESILGKEF